MVGRKQCGQAVTRAATLSLAPLKPFGAELTNLKLRDALLVLQHASRHVDGWLERRALQASEQLVEAVSALLSTADVQCREAIRAVVAMAEAAADQPASAPAAPWLPALGAGVALDGYALQQAEVGDAGKRDE